MKSEEEIRLKEPVVGPVDSWKKWGPYVSERAWSTVREDYSANGDPWSYFPFDQAASKTYRWGEDGIAGWCDRYQILAFAPAFWNGKDPILKERLFGLSFWEGNHGEDVKEYYYHLDGTPTHSYMKFLYKYPQGEFPYQKLKDENRNRGTKEPEYELADTGIFTDNRYFDIFIEYAKVTPEDTCIKITAFNRGPDSAPLHILPHLWFRNQWVWEEKKEPQPNIVQGEMCLIADDEKLISPPKLGFDYHLGKIYLYGPEKGKVFFTDNETGLKDAFHRKIIRNDDSGLKKEGTKACFQYQYEIPAGESITLKLRLCNKKENNPLDVVDEIVEKRKKEADEFYETIHPKGSSAEEKLIQRQALAGILWSKQIYLYDVDQWLKGDKPPPPPESRYHIRNIHWKHLNSMRILLMPDKWEYPFFASWDQAFHCVALGLVDIELAKEQLWLLLFDQFQHPNGQIPAYEWEFSDLNPPVQAWALLRLYEMEKKLYGKEDRDFLLKCYNKLLMNFAWWVNKVDNEGNNVFEGGFLGLDNISVVDRSHKIILGMKLEQSDGTGWMAMFCLNLMRISLELAKKEPIYESLGIKFFEHYIYIASAMKKLGSHGHKIWNEQEGFFYDILLRHDGGSTQFNVRSLVGIIPLYAVELLTEEEIKRFPEFEKDYNWFVKHRQDIVEHCIIPIEKNGKKSVLLTIVDKDQLEHILKYVWSPNEFRAPFGLRSLSKYHEEYPFIYEDRRIGYEPAEALEKIKGGNSNWRGPVWFPTTFLLIDSLKKYGKAFGEDLKISVEKEASVNLKDMALSFSQRLVSLFLKDQNGIRPFFGEHFAFKNDPLWRDHLYFNEYFHPETGKGLGASHQTGWSALVGLLISEMKE